MLTKSTKLQLFLNSILILSLITFSNLEILPLQNLYLFSFFAIIIFVSSLFFAETTFLFFISSIILENINLAPQEIGINIRPYQLLGGILFFTISTKHFFYWLISKSKKSDCKTFFNKIKFRDYLVLIFVFSSFLSSFFSVNKAVSFKQSVIVSSFAIFYFLTRIFVKNFQDLKKAIYFFLNSSLIVTVYGIWQNWRFMQNLNHFEKMTGRPNATFLEPDWLAMFLVFLLAGLYGLVYFRFIANNEKIVFSKIFLKSEILNKLFFRSRSKIIFQDDKNNGNFEIVFFLYFFIFLIYILLLLTVARSGWLGAGVVTIFYLLFVLLNLNGKFGWQKFFQFQNYSWKNFFQQGFTLFFLGILAIISIFSFKLTNFELGNRIQSTSSGNQEITISCLPNFSIDQKYFLNSHKIIENVSELEKYNCRHINLEEIESEEAKGNLVKKIYRKDPNFNVRSESYQKSWQTIQKHFILGVGWGNIGSILGKAEDGTELNASNIFLEIWLGAGIFGLISFILILINIFWQGFDFVQNENFLKKCFGLFLLLGLVAILVPNLFNAGILLGFLWLFLGLLF